MKTERQEAATPKGEAARHRILLAALREFSRHGFDRTTTRAIATLANVKQPALAYYFIDKEGLYRACATLVIDRFAESLSTVNGDIVAALADGCDARRARALLLRLLTEIGRTLHGDDEFAPAATFLWREMNDHGPAFTMFFDRILQTGLALMSDLIVRARPGATIGSARAEALWLLGGISAVDANQPAVGAMLGAPTHHAVDDMLQSLFVRLYGDDSR